MKRTLYLMRHAKSSWKKPLPDRERPLNRRGKEAAERIGRELVKRGITPDLILASDAKRARSTAKRLLRAFPTHQRALLQLDPALYDADARKILQEIARTDPKVRQLMVIAHNPGISELAALLTSDRSLEWLPTGALVGIEIEGKDWKAIEPGDGELILRLFPRELE
ncbi:histidine phosphatase family protein [Nitratifractor sp.]|uniref:SixA phosphatase family protein n=1 Tax=Nitratifractor sp. TaxID=2268144 RepID=UPI0025CE7F40|nr:histidine phosphatase family protein [Nitratifractor sp.]